MKCNPTNEVIPTSFDECCNCSLYDLCDIKKYYKKEGILIALFHLFDGMRLFRLRKAARVRLG